MSINQLIKPITVVRNKNLSIGSCDIVDLAQQYGTPLYVIDEATLRGICREYKNAFKNYPKIKMTYASKALCNMAISKIVESEGFGFDAVSAGEIYTLYKAGVNMNNVTFNGNNKTEDEISFALSMNIGLFSVDNFYEAELLNRLAIQNNKQVNIILRITPGIECHTHEYIKTGQIDSKFGFDLSQLDLIVEKILTEYHNLNLLGLHAHIGSQIFEAQSYRDEINILLDELARLNNKFGISLAVLNIGGGLGVKYTDEDTPISIEEFSNTILAALENKKDLSKNITIYIEPGRSIISTAGITLYTAGSSKTLPDGKKYVALDGGMADNPRPAMYKAKYVAEIANDTEGRKCETITLAGKYCESGDILIENIRLPKIQAGDVICIYNTGAYNYSMASNYNRTQKPAMVLVNNSQSDIIVNRESLEDLIVAENIPDRLSNNG